MNAVFTKVLILYGIIICCSTNATNYSTVELRHSKQNNNKEHTLFIRFISTHKSISREFSRIERVGPGTSGNKAFLKKISTFESLGKQLDRSLKQSRYQELKKLFPFSRLIKQMKSHFLRLDSNVVKAAVNVRLSATLSVTSYNKDVAFYKSADWMITQQIRVLKNFSYPTIQKPYRNKLERVKFNLVRLQDTYNTLLDDFDTRTLIDYISIKDTEVFTKVSDDYAGTSKHICNKSCGVTHLYVRELRKEGLVVRAKGSMLHDAKGNSCGLFFPKVVKSWYKSANGKLYASGTVSPDKRFIHEVFVNYLQRQITPVRMSVVNARNQLLKRNYNVDLLLKQIVAMKTLLKKYKVFPTQEAFLVSLEEIGSGIDEMIKSLQVSIPAPSVAEFTLTRK